MNPNHHHRVLLQLTAMMAFWSLFSCHQLQAQFPANNNSSETAPGQTWFEMHPVDLDVPGIHCIKVLDLDLDGDLDIVGGSENTPSSTSIGLIWWRNDGGYPVNWTRFTVDGAFRHIMSVDAGLIDDDQFPDIVASSWQNGKISWWKNSGDPQSGWTRHDVISGWTNPHDGVIQDIDKDGRNDIIGASAGDNKISVFYNQAGDTPSWHEEILTSGFGGAKSVKIADLNNDSLPDIIGSGDICDEIAWWKNSEKSSLTWEKQLVTSTLNGSLSTDALDMNNDGQSDIIGTGWEGNEISVWTCLDIASNLWNRTLVTDQLSVAVHGIGSDIDLDGKKDIVAIGKIPGELSVFYNEDTSFAKVVLYPEFSGGSALAVTDIDNDNDYDIIAGAGLLKTLYLFENKIINTSTSELSKKSPELIAKPNPAFQHFFVELQETGLNKVKAEIYNYLGENVYSNSHVVSNGGITFYPSGLPKGLYLFQVLTSKGILRGKVILN